MEKKIEVTINGVAYPCRWTMGAMLLFKQQTGREATTVTPEAVSDMITLIWCCIKSASRHERIDFNLSLEDFADGITPDEATTMFSVLGSDDAQDEGGDEKKTRHRKA